VFRLGKKSLFGSSMILPIVRRVYPTQIANDIVSVQPMKAPDNNVFYLKPKYTNTGSGATLDEQEPELTDQQIVERNRLDKMTLKQKKRVKKPRHSKKSAENHLLDKWSTFLKDVPEDKAKNIATILESQEKHLKGI